MFTVSVVELVFILPKIIIHTPTFDIVNYPCFFLSALTIDDTNTQLKIMLMFSSTRWMGEFFTGYSNSRPPGEHFHDVHS